MTSIFILINIFFVCFTIGLQGKTEAGEQLRNPNNAKKTVDFFASIENGQNHPWDAGPGLLTNISLLHNCQSVRCSEELEMHSS